MHEVEFVQRSKNVNRMGGPLTVQIEVTHPATMTVSGTIYGHASVLTKDIGSFTLVAPDGSTLVNRSVQGENRVFLPMAEPKEARVSGSFEVGPGVYVAQVNGTNNNSGGSVTVEWVERVPVAHSEPAKDTGTGTGGSSKGAGAGGFMTASFSLGQTKVPAWGAAVALLVLGVGVAAVRGS